MMRRNSSITSGSGSGPRKPCTAAMVVTSEATRPTIASISAAWNATSAMAFCLVCSMIWVRADL